MSRACYGFKPSLERTAELYGFPGHQLPRRERALIEKFQEAAHLHFPAQLLPMDENWLGWMSLIQHYGGPTRLLDFTKSFYCAVFFALERTNQQAAVWAVDYSTLEHRAAEILGVEGQGEPDRKVRSRILAGLNSFVGEDNGPRLACPVFPTRLHERLAYQQGLFVTSGRSDVPFELQLFETLEIGEDEFKRVAESPREKVPVRPNFDELEAIRVVKIEIEPNLHKKARRELKRMNLTSASLFPGPDGYARALHWELGDMQVGEVDVVPEGGFMTAEDLRRRCSTSGSSRSLDSAGADSEVGDLGQGEE